MACLAGLGGGIYAMASGGSKQQQQPGQAPNTPPINASSSDEADFVQYDIYIPDHQPELGAYH